ncbi:MAG: TldD/PmbA family protein [Chrysiogenetes bacterium]|nr:TldD/PmbA family protein [Chrysiogenetes bacterium]
MAYLSDKAALRHLERVLRSAGVDGWEIYLSGTRELSVEARDGEVESLQRAVSRGVGVRVLRGGAPGFAFTTNFRAEALDAAARAATDAARYATPDPALALIAPQRLPKKDLALFDPALSRVSQKKRVAMALELEAATRAADKRITQVRSASYEEDASWLHLRNSEGLCLEDRETSAGLSVMAVAGDEDESEAGYEFQDVRFFAELNPARVARGAARDAVRQLGARPVPGKSGPVVFENLAASELLDVMADSFCADQVQKGMSGLEGKRGKRVFGEHIDILDDGLLKKGQGSAFFDDEGVPQQRTHLVSCGELLGYLYDSASARREGARSTGNAVRSGGFTGAPEVGVTNLFVKKGKHTLPALLSEMGNGFLITELMGVHTANPVTGEFSFGCAGQVVRGGKIAHPFKGMAVAGNLFDLYKRVELVGSDLRFSSGVGSPSLLVGKLSVSGG